MARTKQKRAEPKGPLARIIERERRDDASAPLVNRFAEQHGDYDRNLRHVVNRGGTPIARWRRDGILTDSQNWAIDHCIGEWEWLGMSGGMVANLDRTVFGSPGMGHSREIEARDNLHRMKGHVGDQYWSIFENVVRFDEPAGVAGSRMACTPSNREAMARHCVQFVADIIAMKERLAR